MRIILNYKREFWGANEGENEGDDGIGHGAEGGGREKRDVVLVRPAAEIKRVRTRLAQRRILTRS